MEAGFGVALAGLDELVPDGPVLHNGVVGEPRVAARVLGAAVGALLAECVGDLHVELALVGPHGVRLTVGGGVPGHRGVHDACTGKISFRLHEQHSTMSSNIRSDGQQDAQGNHNETVLHTN